MEFRLIFPPASAFSETRCKYLGGSEVKATQYWRRTTLLVRGSSDRCRSNLGLPILSLSDWILNDASGPASGGYAYFLGFLGMILSAGCSAVASIASFLLKVRTLIECLM